MNTRTSHFRCVCLASQNTCTNVSVAHAGNQMLQQRVFRFRKFEFAKAQASRHWSSMCAVEYIAGGQRRAMGFFIQDELVFF